MTSKTWVERQAALEDRSSGNKVVKLPAGKKLSIRNAKGREVAWINSLGAASFASEITIQDGQIDGDLLVNGSLTVTEDVILSAVVKEDEPSEAVAGMLWIDPSTEPGGEGGGGVVPPLYIAAGKVGVGVEAPAAILHVDAPAVNTQAVLVGDGLGALDNTLISGYGSLLTLNLVNGSYDYQLAYINEASGKVANYMGGSGELNFDNYSLSDEYRGSNCLLPFGGFSFYHSTAPYKTGGLYVFDGEKVGIGELIDWEVAANNTPVVTVDMTESRVGIGTDAPTALLELGADAGDRLIASGDSQGVESPEFEVMTRAAEYGSMEYPTWGELNGTLFFAGGYNAAGYSDTVWASEDGGATWEIRAPTVGVDKWAGRAYLAPMVEFLGQLWMVGGYGDDGALGDVWKMHTTTTDGRNWELVTDAPGWGTRSDHALVVFAGKMWLIGGYNYDAPYWADVWNTEDGETWTQVTADGGFGARHDHSAAVHDGKMWIMGGYTENDPTGNNDVWHSTDGVTWTKAEDVPNAGTYRIAPGLVSFDGKMWVISGDDDGTTYTTTDGATWDAASLPVGFNTYIGAAVISDVLHIWGGYYNTNAYQYELVARTLNPGIVIDSQGFVGIGKATPGYLLDAAEGNIDRLTAGRLIMEGDHANLVSIADADGSNLIRVDSAHKTVNLLGNDSIQFDLGATGNSPRLFANLSSGGYGLYLGSTSGLTSFSAQDDVAPKFEIYTSGLLTAPTRFALFCQNNDNDLHFVTGDWDGSHAGDIAFIAGIAGSDWETRFGNYNIDFSSTGTGSSRFIASAADNLPLLVQGFAAQTANLQEWRDSSDDVMASISPDGDLMVGGKVGFYGTAPVAQQTGVAVSAAAIHAALVALGLITA